MSQRPGGIKSSFSTCVEHPLLLYILTAILLAEGSLSGTGGGAGLSLSASLMEIQMPSVMDIRKQGDTHR